MGSLYVAVYEEKVDWGRGRGGVTIYTFSLIKTTHECNARPAKNEKG